MGRAYTKAALVAELRRVAAVLRGHYSQSEFRRASSVSIVTVLARFGSWNAALRAAGLRRRALPRAIGGKYTWQQCLANLARLHRRLGRPPRRFEADCPPSAIGSMAYIARFGSWRGALAAFAAHSTGDESAWPLPTAGAGRAQGAHANGRAAKVAREARRRAAEGSAKIATELRFKVMKRDRFRCVACGASPANDPKVVLQVDHRRPRAEGGGDGIDNLQTLCAPCNNRKAAFEAVWFPPRAGRAPRPTSPPCSCASGPGGGRARRSGCP